MAQLRFNQNTWVKQMAEKKLMKYFCHMGYSSDQDIISSMTCHTGVPCSPGQEQGLAQPQHHYTLLSHSVPLQKKSGSPLKLMVVENVHRRQSQKELLLLGAKFSM